MKLFEGALLRVDLTEGTLKFEDFSAYKPYLGGRAVNQLILLRETPRSVAPFDPANVLAVGAGILAGTEAPGACRVSVDSRNALTDGIGSGNAGGYFGPEMRFAGINNIILKGRCPSLSYLYIEDGEARIVPEEALRGKTISETERFLRDRHGEVKTLTIGPAGENRVRAAAIIVDGARAVGRCGLGAVMGAKNLKAIAVKGSGSVEPARPEAFDRLVEELNSKLAANPFNQLRMKYGVYCYPPWDKESPYRNFSGRVPPPESREKLLPDEFYAYKQGEQGCYACPIRCWSTHEFQDSDGPVHVEAFQGNDPHNFGAKLDLPNPRHVLKAHALCNELGLDVDNASGVIAWATDCFEQGLIGTEDTGGLSLRWGDAGMVFRLLEDLAYRRGFGDLLAEGSVKAARKLGKGTEERSVHVKGQELMECLWVSPSWALGTVVSPRGGTHTRGAALEGRFQGVEEAVCRRYFGIPDIGAPTDYENKERLVYFFERLEAFLDCIGVCMFTNSLRLDMLLPEDYARLLSAASGEDFDLDGILLAGERTHNIEKLFNVLHTDWGRQEDLPPERFVKVALDGEHAIDPVKWEKMLDRYYALHGWDDQGRPTAEILHRLGLEEAAVPVEGPDPATS